MKTHLTALTLFTMMTPFSEAADVTVNFAGVNTLSGQLYQLQLPDLSVVEQIENISLTNFKLFHHSID